MTEIVRVTSAGDAAAVAALVDEFFGWLRVRYPEKTELIDAYHEAQDVAGEMATLTERFRPPYGVCLLARLDGRPAGTVMLKRVTDGLCEMNRMFVTEAARGRGVARALVLALFDEARGMGFEEMRLEALNRHREALPLYRSLGFGPDPEPTEMALSQPDMVSLRRRL